MENKRFNRTCAVGEVFNISLPPVLQIAFQLAEMERRWGDIAGPQLASCTQPLCLEQKVLVIACKTPAAAQYVNMSGATLLGRIRNRVGLELAGVRAVVRAPEKPRRRAEPKGRRSAASDEAVEDALSRAETTIKDPELALAFARAEAAAQARWGGGRRKKASGTGPSSGQSPQEPQD